MSRVYGYLRCSFLDEEKDKKGIAMSIPTQLERIRHYFTYQQSAGNLTGHRWAIVGWQGIREEGHETQDGFFVDKDVSAYKKQFLGRPAGRRLSTVLERGDTVIFARLDRAFRNVEDALATIGVWQRRGINAHFLDPQVDLSTAHGRAFFQMAAVWAEFSSALHSERMREVCAQAARTGRSMNGQAQLGFTRDGRPDQKERAVIAWILHLRKSLELPGWRQVAEVVEAELARREGRKPVPHHEGQGARAWPHSRCRRGAMAAERLGIQPAESLIWDAA